MFYDCIAIMYAYVKVENYILDFIVFEWIKIMCFFRTSLLGFITLHQRNTIHSHVYNISPKINQAYLTQF